MASSYGEAGTLSYVAQADGEVEIVVQQGDTTNSWPFTLQVDVSDPVVVEPGGTTSVEPDGTSPRYAVFSGTAGEVVNVWATSQGEDDLVLGLYGAKATDNGLFSLIEEDNDDGASNNPYLRRVVLSTDGYYLLEAVGWENAELTAAVDFNVDTTEQLFLTAEPYAFTLENDGIGTEVLMIDATANTTYRITVTAARSSGVHMQLDLIEFFLLPAPTFDVQYGSRLVWEFLTPQSRHYRLDVHLNRFSSGDDYTMAMEVVQ